MFPYCSARFWVASVHGQVTNPLDVVKTRRGSLANLVAVQSQVSQDVRIERSLTCWASLTHPMRYRSSSDPTKASSALLLPRHQAISVSEVEKISKKAWHGGLSRLTLQNCRWVLERLHAWYRNLVRGIASTFSSIWRHLASMWNHILISTAPCSSVQPICLFVWLEQTPNTCLSSDRHAGRDRSFGWLQHSDL